MRRRQCVTQIAAQSRRIHTRLVGWYSIEKKASQTKLQRDMGWVKIH